MNEIKIAAFRIAAEREGQRYSIPKKFLTDLGVKNSNKIAKAWRPNIDVNVTSRNIQDAKGLPSTINASETWAATFIEARPEKTIELVNIINGNKSSIEIDKDHSKYQEWSFCILPNKNLLILKLKGKGVENKLAEYLKTHIYEWSKDSDCIYDSIHISAIPKESEPTKYLRSNPNLASVSFRIKSKSIDTKYGLFGGLFEGLGSDDKDYLVLNVEISNSKRGGKLPDISLSTAADILETLSNDGNDSLIQTSVKPTLEGRRNRGVHLLNAITEKTIYLKEGDDIFNHLCQFATEIDLGTGLELDDE